MSPARMAKVESAIRVVLEFNEAFNRHDIPGMMRLVSEDCVFENSSPAPDGTVHAGREALTLFWRDFFGGSPRARIEIEDIFGMGLRCVMNWRYEWVDAEGQQGHIRGVDIFQVENGLICRELSYVKG